MFDRVPIGQCAGVVEGQHLVEADRTGPKLAALLREQGIIGFAQIAAWTDDDIDRIDPTLGRFEGRIRRDDWVGQARLLAAGDESGFASRYGKIS